MKANSTKRKIFDAVDLLTEDTSSQMPVKTITEDDEESERTGL